VNEAHRVSGLVTIGYQGVSLEGFLETLKKAGVTLLLDVRELPMSRRTGFSRTPLSQALGAAGIAYRHVRALGTPKRIRHRLRRDRDMKRFFAEYQQHLATQEALLEDLAQTLSGCVALMCFERDPAVCHRSVVAEDLAKRLGTQTRDLFVED